MKKYIALAVALVTLAACGSKKATTKYNTKALPTGLEVSDFEAYYDKPYGKYMLTCVVRNLGEKRLDVVELEATLLIEGKEVGKPTGGPGKILNAGDSGVVTFAWILPNKQPDEVVLKSIGDN